MLVHVCIFRPRTVTKRIHGTQDARIHGTEDAIHGSHALVLQIMQSRCRFVANFHVGCLGNCCRVATARDTASGQLFLFLLEPLRPPKVQTEPLGP